MSKSFGAFRAIDDVSLSLSQYEVKAVIGPNGAGKSTLFSCLGGTQSPSAGTIRFNGENVTYLPVHRRVQKGLVKSFQTTSIFPGMSVEENILTAAVAVSHWSIMDVVVSPGRRPDILARLEEVLRDTGLLEQRRILATSLSHGDQRKLEIAIALACGASILLLDEPTAGMGVDDIEDFMEVVRRLRQRCGILLVEHNMSIVLGLSDRVTVLAHGRVICDGPPDVVRRDPVVRQAYLGRREI